MAIQDFTHALKVKPDFPAVLVSRGAAYCDLGDYEAALADSNQALNLSPGDLSAIAQRGKIYQVMGRPEDALPDLNYVLTQDPDNVSLLVSRGIVFQQLEQYDQAMADFNRLLELESDNQEALANRGETYRRLERYEEAISDLSRVIEQNPDENPDAAWDIGIRGTAYRQLGYLSKALEDYNEAIGLDSNNDWWYYSRALTQRLSGQLDSAQADLTTAIQIAITPTFRSNVRSKLNLALYYLANQEVKKAATIYQGLLPKASLVLRKGAIRELKELLKVIPISLMISPDSKESNILREVFFSLGLITQAKGLDF